MVTLDKSPLCGCVTETASKSKNWRSAQSSVDSVCDSGFPRYKNKAKAHSSVKTATGGKTQSLSDKI